ncbi:MAG: GntR family transcriptional regulator, partial [Mycoplasmatales bacterium]
MIKKTSLYLQLAESIINDINSKRVKPGEQILTEKELMIKFSVSRFTVREAINYLGKNDYVEKKHGIGTFVKENAISQKLFKFYSFSEEMKKIGKKPLTKIISFSKERANGFIAEKLNILEDSVIYKMDRLRLANNEIIMYEITYLPQKIFFGLEAEFFDKKSMYDVFQDKYGIIFSGAREKFTALIPAKNILKKLDLDKVEACMKIERTTYMNNFIIEYTVSFAR